MWYVIQVFTGQEEKMKEICEYQIPGDVLEKCFIPYYEEMKKYLGEWHKEKKILFPGYLFVITEQITALHTELKKIQGFTRILGDQTYLLPLTDGEVAFIQRFGGEEHLVEMSQGVIENDEITIIDGPLKGFEGCIKRIDRHKRKAEIQIEMFGQLVNTTVGIEIIKRTAVKMNEENEEHNDTINEQI
ncbi:MAG: antiterminator LoaP [Eubacteriales bacterium]|nr:antiterminator LoaP [Eubacteriales bacterium]